MAIKEVVIKTDYINLGQVLKLVNVINSGAQAKWFLKQNQILINNQPENRRGRKLYENDQITYLDNTFVIKKYDRSKTK